MLAVVLAVIPFVSYAATVVDMAHGDTQFVKISRKDLNRIVVPHEEPKVFTGSPALDVKIEGNNIFVRTEDSFTTAELFIVSADRTYSLILLPAEIPAQTIIIRDPAASAKEAAEWEKSHDYVSTVKALVKAMASESVPEGYKVTDYAEIPNKTPEQYVFKGCLMTAVREFQGFRLAGIEYTLANQGKEPVHFLENEFHRRGVLAVSLEKHTLEPQEKTRLYVVKEDGGE